jgi:hypothetical protein
MDVFVPEPQCAALAESGTSDGGRRERALLEPPRERENMVSVRQAQKQLQTKIGELERLRDDLLALEAEIPSSTAALSEEDIDADRGPDPADEIKVVVRCVVHDYLDPSIRDLGAAAAYRPGRSRHRSGQPLARQLGLSTFSEETRRALYEIVVRDNFTPRQLDGSEDLWSPPYTGEQAGVEVFWSHGRWFATWLKLEEPEDLPEAERRELLLLEEDPAEPGTLLYREV